MSNKFIIFILVCTMRKKGKQCLASIISKSDGQNKENNKEQVLSNC